MMGHQLLRYHLHGIHSGKKQYLLLSKYLYGIQDKFAV